MEPLYPAERLDTETVEQILQHFESGGEVPAPTGDYELKASWTQTMGRVCTDAHTGTFRDVA